MQPSRQGGAPPKVELRDVDLRYFGLEGETEALKGISLSVAPAEFVAIIGQSGCGKSTLLSLISGILRPTDGDVLVDAISGESHRVSGGGFRVGDLLARATVAVLWGQTT